MSQYPCRPRGRPSADLGNDSGRDDARCAFGENTRLRRTYPIHVAHRVDTGKARFECLLVYRNPARGISRKSRLDNDRRDAMHRYPEEQFVRHFGSVAQHRHLPVRLERPAPGCP